MQKPTKPRGKRLSFAVVLGVLMAALAALPAYADNYGGGTIGYNNQPTAGGNNGVTVTWDIQYAPDMSPAANPQRTIISGSGDAVIESHYPYANSEDMKNWYVYGAGEAGGLEAAGMQCLAYWQLAVYDLGKASAPTNSAAQVLIDEALSKKAEGNYGWWSARQVLYAGVPMPDTYNTHTWEKEPTNTWYAIPPIATGMYNRPGEDGWGYHYNQAWPEGLNYVLVNSYRTGGMGKTAQYKLDVVLDATPGTEAWGHVFWISLVGVSGREKVVGSEARAVRFWEEPPPTKPSITFRVNVKPAGYSGLGWIVARSGGAIDGSIGRWANTGKPINLKATLENTVDCRIYKIVIEVSAADTIEGDNITKLRFSGHTPGAKSIVEDGRVIGYEWNGWDLRNLNPSVTFYYTEVENTTFSFEYYGTGIDTAANKKAFAKAGYTLIVGGTRLVNY